MILAVLATAFAVALHLLGYVWHRPPEPVYYLVLLLNYAPKWVWLGPAGLALLISLGERRLSKAIAGALLLTVLWMQDIQFAGLLSSPEDSAASITLMTLNTGGASTERVAQLINTSAADIVMLQEFREKALSSVVDETWSTHCTAHICIASRFSITVLDTYSRAQFSDWGSFAAAYEVRLNDEKVRLVNAHLETPRDALGGRPLLDYNEREIDAYDYEKHIELSILAAHLDIQAPAIVAGDLNTSIFEAAYQRHLGKYNNAVDIAAAGINYTKYTRWHGVRIDHVITNDRVVVSDAGVLASAGGDHRPLLVRLMLK